MRVIDWMCVIILVGLLLGSGLARADDCTQAAQLVDALERIEPEKRHQTFERWLEVVNGDRYRYRIVMRAWNWIESGGTGDGAWRTCNST